MNSVGLINGEYKVGVGRRNVGGTGGRHGDEYNLYTLCECMNSSKIHEKIPFKEFDGTDKEGLKMGFQPLQGQRNRTHFYPCINFTFGDGMCWRP